LGISYIEGVGTRYNPNMAAAFFQQAAFNGVAEAAYNLGLILENGLLGEVRPNDALKWYQNSANAGNTDAQGAMNALAASMNVPVVSSGVSNIDDLNLGTLVPTNEQIMVAQIQEQLRKAGLYTGPQDGIVGAGTVKAIRTYQRSNSLPTDGQTTQNLLTFMLQQGTGL
jgi:TPR repeat protein